MSPDDLKDRLALVEVMAGGFLGLVVETLFGHMTKPEASARQE
jgi:hypothetical protein